MSYSEDGTTDLAVYLARDQAEQMCEAAERNRVELLAGHTRAFTPRHVWSTISIWSDRDWILRPRTAHELDLAQGGGVPYRQVRTRWTRCGCLAVQQHVDAMIESTLLTRKDKDLAIHALDSLFQGNDAASYPSTYGYYSQANVTVVPQRANERRLTTG